MNEKPEYEPNGFRRSLTEISSRTSVRLTVGVASSCALLMSPTLVGNAASPAAMQANTPSLKSTGLDDQIDSSSKQLDKASKEVREARKVLQETNTLMPAAKKKLARAQAGVENAESRAKAADGKLRAVEKRIVAAKTEVEKTKKEVEELRDHVALLARDIYVSGGAWQELEILLESKDPSQFAERYMSFRRVANLKNNSLDELAVAQRKLAQKLAELDELEAQAQANRDAAAKARAEAQVEEGKAAKAKAELDVLVAKREKALRAAASERREVQSQLDALLSEQRRVLAAARAAAAKAAAKNNGSSGSSNGGSSGGSNSGSGGGSGGGGSAPTGSLNWPTPGYSAGGRTGPRVHPVYGYSSCHTGVDVGAPSGTPIRAAASGTVVSASYGSVYGNNILISHSGGLSTMYAHQSRMAVSSGQRVSRGQTIGYVGSTGYSTGPHLHFEVHVNGVPYEPMGWFGGSKYRVTCWRG